MSIAKQDAFPSMHHAISDSKSHECLYIFVSLEGCTRTHCYFSTMIDWYTPCIAVLYFATTLTIFTYFALVTILCKQYLIIMR